MRSRSVTACAVLITHARGMASVRLRDLAPEMQEAFGYDLAADRASDVALQKAPAERQAVLAAAAKSVTAAKPSSNSGKVDHLLRYFGQAANVRSDVDLRPQFRALELHAKDQGPRPSCSVFAVVSALGFLSRGSHRPGGEAVGGISHLVHAAEHPAGGPGCGPADG